MIISKIKFSKYIDNKKINKKILSLASKINKDYKNKEVVFLCVLDGSFMFASKLYSNIKIKSCIDFVRIKSYKGIKSSNKIRNIIGLPNIKNKHVIIIEDIVDSGKTMSYLINKIFHKCKSLKIATLLSKPDVHDLHIDYIGFEIDNRFVIGYGLDYNGLGRNLKDIYEKRI